MDLGLVPIEALIDELLSRATHGVIGLMLPGEGRDAAEVRRSWHGNPHTCAGLAYDVARRVLAQSDRQSEPLVGEEEDRGAE